MEEMKRIHPFEAAKQIVQKYYPNCDGAVLAGSVVRGEATNTSDLDLVVFDSSLKNCYRESFIDFGWPVEVFVNNLSSYKGFFASDAERARPSLPRMVSEGIIIKDKGIVEGIKEEAKAILEKGPEQWSAETIKIKRYFLTDTLDDFIGCTNRAEELFIANTLGDLLSEFVLRVNGYWIGTSKWIIRALKQYDEQFTQDFVEAFDLFYREGKKEFIIKLVDRVLEPFGGRLFEGFQLGKS